MHRRLLQLGGVVLLFSGCVAGLIAQTPTQVSQAKALIQQAQQLLNQATALLTPPPIVAGVPIRPGDDLAAKLTAAPGATFVLDPAFVWTAPLTITSSVTLKGPAGTTRMDATTALPKLLGGVTVTASNVTLSGLELQNTVKDQEILVLGGANPVIDRVRVLGSPVNGQHRGIRANAANVTIRKSYVDYVWAIGQDTQAIASWDSPGPILIDDCFLSASGETVLFGGADAASIAGWPSDITIQNSTLTKRLDWRGKPGLTVKNTLELKNARRVKVLNNIIENTWAQGQEGFLIVLTPRNQSGTNPWAAVQDVLIQRNQIRHGAAAFNISGTDNDNQSGLLQRAQILDNAFTDIDPAGWGSVAGSLDPNTWGANKLIQIGSGPTDLAIQRNVCSGCKNIGSWLYFYGVKAVNVVATDNQVPPSLYGIWGEFGGFAASTTGTSSESNNVVVPQ